MKRELCRRLHRAMCCQMERESEDGSASAWWLVIPCREAMMLSHDLAYFLQRILSVEVDDGLAMPGPVLGRRALQNPRLAILIRNRSSTSRSNGARDWDGDGQVRSRRW